MKLQPADAAWMCIGLGVLGFDSLCDEGGTLSEACDRYMVSHPWLVRGVAFAVAAHVSNAVQPRYDVVHWLFVLSRKWRRP